MQVPHPYCYTCGKRISPFQAPFRRMRLGIPTTKDLFWYLNIEEKYNKFIHYTEKKLMSVNDAFLKLDISKTDRKTFQNLKNEPIEAKKFFETKGIVRGCCMARIEHPPVVPIINSEKPIGSIIELDTGLQKRLLIRSIGDDAYTVHQVYSPVQQSEATKEEEEEEEDAPKKKKKKKKHSILQSQELNENLDQDIEDLRV